MSTNASVGIAQESTYGTPTTASIRHLPFLEDGLNPVPGLVSASEEVRAGSLAERVDQGVPYPMGGEGAFRCVVPTKGFGIWLLNTFGAVSTSAIVDSNYTHTFTPSITGLNGRSLTYQANRPFHPSGTSQAVTFHGVKVNSMTLSAEVDGFLEASFDLDAEDHDLGTTTLAALVYPSIAVGGAKFPWSLASVTVNAIQVETKSFEVVVNNNLDVDRRYIRGSALKKEPTRGGKMSVEWSLEIDWADLTQYNRVHASTMASRVTTIAATFDGPVPLGGATVPRLTVTIHAARFDEGMPTVTDSSPLMQELSGVGLEDGTNPAVTVTYRTTDALP